jgi:hypothetical protein
VFMQYFKKENRRGVPYCSSISQDKRSLCTKETKAEEKKLKQYSFHP